jgi:protoporphyrinogen/coproporphyrinogen III oxidase
VPRAAERKDLNVTRVVVVGAGVTGLAAALALGQAGADAIVIEQSDRAGGALRSHASGGFLFEDGPTSILDMDGTAGSFLRDLGLEGEIVSARPEARERYLWHRDALRHVPSKPAEFIGSPLLSVLERVRVLREPFVAAAPPGVEETVSEFAARRFGSGVATKFAAAIVSGIFAGDPDKLSLDACFPEIRAIERAHGSLLKGLAARAKERKESAGSPRSAGMITLRSGLGRVGAAAAEKLGARLRTGTSVLGLASDAGGVKVSVERGGARETIEADAAILATPARVAASLQGALPRPVAETLAPLEHASLAVVQAGFSRESLPGLPPGFGFLVPRDGGLESLGWIFLSQVFEGRAPEGAVALTAFFGGMLAPRSLERDDAALGALALRELGRVLGLRAPPEAAFLRVVRWRDMLPQYGIGHAGRIAGAVELLSRERPRVVLAGNYLEGVSIPRCIASGRAAAARLNRVAVERTS